MAEAAAADPTGMSAVLGGDRDERARRASTSSTSPRRTTTAAVRSSPPAPSTRSPALAAAPPAGTRVIPLQVAGAFHTRFMAPAVDDAARPRPTVDVADPTLTLWSNRDGARVDRRRRARSTCSSRRSPRPCAGTSAMESFAAHGVTGHHRARPRRARSPGSPSAPCRGVPTVAVKTPDDLAAAAALRHSEHARMTATSSHADPPLHPVHRPRAHAHLRLRRRPRRDRRAQRRPRRPDRLQRRVDPAAHRHHHPHAARTPRPRRSTCRRMPPPRPIARSGVDPRRHRRRHRRDDLATPSRPRRSPRSSPTASGANPAAAYDVNAACAGFAYGVAQADALIRARRRALRRSSIGAEKLSDVVDPTDRSHLVPARRRRGRRRHRPERLRRHRPDRLGLRRLEGRRGRA